MINGCKDVFRWKIVWKSKNTRTYKNKKKVQIKKYSGKLILFSDKANVKLKTSNEPD